MGLSRMSHQEASILPLAVMAISCGDSAMRSLRKMTSLGKPMRLQQVVLLSLSLSQIQAVPHYWPYEKLITR